MDVPAKHLDQLSPEEKRTLLAQMLRKKINAPQVFPLSFAQQRLWFLDQLEPGSATYNIFFPLHINGSFLIQALERSVAELVQRHASLRTTFVTQNEQPVQVVHAAVKIALPLLDLQSFSAEALSSISNLLIHEESHLPFHFATGPLLRMLLVRLGPENHVLFLSMHHIISDAWSQQILMRELVILYRAFVEGKASPLSPLPLHYADFAVWQRNWLQGTVLQAHIDYWRNQLRGAVALELPTDHPRSGVQSSRGASHSFMLPPDVSEALHALSRQQEATLFMVLLTAFQILLYRMSGQTDIVVGTDVANRMLLETENLIGFFVNLLALRTNIDQSSTFRHFLYQVRTMVLDAYTYQSLPFEMVVESLRLERQRNRTPLVNVLFVLQNIPRSSQQVEKKSPEPVPGIAPFSRFEIAVFLREWGDRIGGEVVYASDLFEEQSILLLISRFNVLLRSIITDPDASIKILDMYTEAEKEEQIKAKQGRHRLHLHNLRGVKGKEIDVRT